QGVAVFGPSKTAAQLEGSKNFSRVLMKKYGIPTPEFHSFDDPAHAKKFVRKLASKGKQSVVKADGLAAGKGAIVTATIDEADAAIDQCMVERKFGDAGDLVVVEERLCGPELSILAITDGQRMVILPPAQDHKPVGEGDTGLNTGGMGAYSPVPIVNEDLMGRIRRTILEPTIKGMEAEGHPYSGVLYAGLMMTDQGPYVIEYNCRFGDPETQAVLPTIKEDLLPLLWAAAQGSLQADRIIEPDHSALCVILASGGYPEIYEKGKEITGIAEAEAAVGSDVMVFHAGTAWAQDRLVTSGGRVLGVTGIGYNFDNACKKAYAAVEKIHFEGVYYRRDIGYRVRGKGMG
ncbi:MAG: phosphoribosylamine--glycine ligase, partial [bacterium]|nr:phosphoribosylamine--glycine ligase [bacterium]